MSYSVFLHPDVEKYLDSLSEGEKKRGGAGHFIPRWPVYC